MLFRSVPFGEQKINNTPIGEKLRQKKLHTVCFVLFLFQDRNIKDNEKQKPLIKFSLGKVRGCEDAMMLAGVSFVLDGMKLFLLINFLRARIS